MKNSVFIATSLDGYIAYKNGGLDWLSTVPNPNNEDNGFVAFTQGIDAIVMGRNTFETVVGFEGEWVYQQPVFVLSNSLKEIPNSYQDKAFLINGTLTDVLDKIHAKGYKNLYIDGGTTIQNFLKEDLIDELIITKIPILLGGGSPLFGELENPLKFEFVSMKTYLGQMVQTHYKRLKN